MPMNLGQRVRGAFEALTGQTAADLAANTEADNTFRAQTEAALAAAGDATTALAAKIEALEDVIDPEQFAAIKADLDSLNAAFPDAEQQPPEDDDEDDDSGV